MADKRTNEEIRQEVLNDDSTRDVNINLGVFVAGAAMLSSAAAVLAVLAIAFLANFRQDVENLWLSCIPMCFTFVTGVAVAYRKQMADVGVHIALAVTTLLAGGAGYGLSVEHVYFNRENCTVAVGYHGECNREVLTTIYFIAGAVASGCAVLGLLGSLCACSNAMSRRARREKYRLMRLQYEETRRKGEVRDEKRRLGQPTFIPQMTTSNGEFEKPASQPKMNGMNGTTKPPVYNTVQNSNEQAPKAPAPLPQITEEQPEMIKDAIKEKPEEQPEVNDKTEILRKTSEVFEDTPKINTTTIIVREIPAERKQAGGVDRGTQVDPQDHVVEPATKDVGVSPYQEDEDDDEAKPVSNKEVPVNSAEDKSQNAESDKAAKVMTHL